MNTLSFHYSTLRWKSQDNFGCYCVIMVYCELLGKKLGAGRGAQAVLVYVPKLLFV